MVDYPMFGPQEALIGSAIAEFLGQLMVGVLLLLNKMKRYGLVVLLLVSTAGLFCVTRGQTTCFLVAERSQI